MGVWIETRNEMNTVMSLVVTPFVGVWIETPLCDCLHRCHSVTPFVGVWIETSVYNNIIDAPLSHPSWVCGLKLNLILKYRPRL